MSRLFIALLLCLGGLSNAFAQGLTLQEGITLRQVQQAQMAPDGDKVAYVVSTPRVPYVHDDGKNWNELYVIDRKGRGKAFIGNQDRIIQHQWSPDGELIWFLAQRDEKHFVSLYAIPSTGGEARLLFSHNAHIEGFDLSQDGKSLLLWGEKPITREQKRLQQKGFKVNIVDEGTERHQLWKLDYKTPGSKAQLIYDQEHVISAKFHPNRPQILLKTTLDGNIDSEVTIPKLQVISDQGQALVSVPHKGKLGAAAFSPNGARIAFIGSYDANSPAAEALYIADARTGKAQILLTEFQGQVTDIQWLTNTTLGFIAHIGTQSIWASKKVGRPSASYRTIVRNDVIFTQVTGNPRGNEIALVGHHPSHPKELFWMKNAIAVRLIDSNPWLRERTLGKQEVKKYKARDGLEIQGVLVTPSDKKKNLPLLLVVHGGPEAHFSNGWMERYWHPAHHAASLGYASFFPNYRGSTALGNRFTKLGQQDYAGKEFDDLVDAKRYLVQEGIVDPDKVTIVGASYGGYAAAWGATSQSEHFAAAVSFLGISNNISKFGTTDIPNEMLQMHLLRKPWDNWQDLLQRSPIYHGDKHKTPLLLLHGLDDTRVHPSQSLELYRQLKIRAQAPVRLINYPGQGHGVTHSAGQLDLAKRLMRWMQHFGIQHQQQLPSMDIGHGQHLGD